MRVCPNCGNKKKILAVLQDISARNIYTARCMCTVCRTDWREVWWRREDITDISEVRVPQSDNNPFDEPIDDILNLDTWDEI